MNTSSPEGQGSLVPTPAESLPNTVLDTVLVAALSAIGRLPPAQAEADRRWTARRSTSPRRLVRPGPTGADLSRMLQAALSAPDHGALRPWRVIEFRAEDRAALAALFEAEKLRRDPLATPLDLQRARAHAVEVPMLLAFVVSPRPKAQVPVREQWLGAGAALGNLLNAAHEMGFGAIVLSGERCHDVQLTQALGLQPHEALAGFVCLGSLQARPPARPLADPRAVHSRWRPPALRG